MNSNARSMLEGYPSLPQHIEATTLKPLQAAKVQALTLAVLLAKYTRGALERLSGKDNRLLEGLDAFKAYKIRAKGTRRRETHGGFHLSAEQVSQFERDGVIGPIRVMEAADAHRLAARARQLHREDWHGAFAYGPEVRAALKRTREWDFDHAGMYQALYHPELWDVLCSQSVAQPLQSLLGDDLLCWRSQFFDKAPGQAGTFWHQAGRFREVTLGSKLVPSEHTIGDDTMLQLSIWIALEDVDEENGALMFAPGTFPDARLEEFGNRILDNPVGAILTRSPERIRQTMHLLQYASSDFVKAQMGFEWACELLPDLFEGSRRRSFPLGAGEALIFSSLNMHASLPNTTEDRTRLAFLGRITTNDVRVLPGREREVFPTREGLIQHSTVEQQCIQIAGTDHFGHNRIKAAPGGPRHSGIMRRPGTKEPSGADTAAAG